MVYYLSSTRTRDSRSAVWLAADWAMLASLTEVSATRRCRLVGFEFQPTQRHLPTTTSSPQMLSASKNVFASVPG